jgi:hypothetical protein
MSEETNLTYQCRAGETFDSVSLALYGDERYAYELLAANPKLCRLIVFSGGEILTVPVVEVPDDEAEDDTAPASAPWKE